MQHGWKLLSLVEDMSRSHHGLRCFFFSPVIYLVQDVFDVFFFYLVIDIVIDVGYIDVLS